MSRAIQHSELVSPREEAHLEGTGPSHTGVRWPEEDSTIGMC